MAAGRDLVVRGCRLSAVTAVGWLVGGRLESGFESEFDGLLAEPLQCANSLPPDPRHARQYGEPANNEPAQQPEIQTSCCGRTGVGSAVVLRRGYSKVGLRTKRMFESADTS